MNRRIGALAVVAGALLAPALMALPAVAAPATPVATQGRVLVLRPHVVQVTLDGALVRSIPVAPGTLTLPKLAALVADPRYLAVSGGVARLSAGIDQRPGTSLSIASPLTRLDLVDVAGSPAALTGTRASLTVDRVSVEAVLPGGAPAPASAHRPYLSYTGGSHLHVSSASFHHLGRPGESVDVAGVHLGTDSYLVATGSRILGGSSGIVAEQVAAITLTDVALDSADGVGLDIRGATRATLTRVSASGNHGDGMVLANVTSRWTLNSLAARGNLLTGVRLHGGEHAVLTATTAVGNREEGLRLDHCASCTVDGATLGDEPLGLKVVADTGLTVRGARIDHVGTGLATDARTSRLSLDAPVISRATIAGLRLAGPGATVAGARVSDSTAGIVVATGASAVTVHGSVVSGSEVGIQVDHGATSVTVSGGRISRATGAGISVGASGTHVESVTVEDSALGLALTDDSSGASIDHLVVQRSDSGLLASPGTSNITVSHADFQTVGAYGIKSSASGLVLSDSSLTGSVTGLELRGTSTVTSSTVSGSEQGIHVYPDSTVTVTGTSVTADHIGINARRGSTVVLDNTDVTAAESIRGKVEVQGASSVSPLPLHWLGIAGLSAVVLAILLEGVRRLRTVPEEREVLAPDHVTNRA